MQTLLPSVLNMLIDNLSVIIGVIFRYNVTASIFNFLTAFMNFERLVVFIVLKLFKIFVTDSYHRLREAF